MKFELPSQPEPLDRLLQRVSDRSIEESGFFALLNAHVLPALAPELALRAITFSSFVRRRKEYWIDWPFKDYYPRLDGWVKENALDVISNLHFDKGVDLCWVRVRYSVNLEGDGIEALVEQLELTTVPDRPVPEFRSADIQAGLATLFHVVAFNPRLGSSSGKYDVLVVSTRTSIRGETGAMSAAFQLTNPHLPLLHRVSIVRDVVLPIIVGRLEGSISNELFLDQSLHSAVAAIMARNMSHNLGSHALRKLDAAFIREAGKASAGVEKSEDVAAFLGYVQQRMDFVARMATDWPCWRQPMFFFRDLVRGFKGQKVLRQYLLADDGYGGKVCFSHASPSSGAAAPAVFSPAGADGESPETDPLVAIPGGVVGAHAFHAFLENALRNAARHGSKRRDQLTAFLGIAEKDEAYEVTYADDLSEDPDGSVRKKVAKILREPLIDESTGVVTESHWGIQEMKVCAQFLGYDGEPESQWVDRLNVAEEVVVNCGAEERSVLGYRFRLCKAVLTAIVDVGAEAKSEPKQAASRERALGIRVVPAADMLDDTHLTIIRRLSPGLVLIRCNDNDREKVDRWVAERKAQLPLRLLIEDREQNNLQQDSEKLILGLYRDWLVKLARQRGWSSLDMVIDFKTDGPDAPKTRWTCLRNAAINTYDVLGEDLSLSLSFSTVRPDTPCFAVDSHADTLQSTDWSSRNSIKEWLRFWQSRGSQNRAAKEAIDNPPEGFAGVLFLLQLLEACLLRILIIDERVAQHVFTVGSDGKVAVKVPNDPMLNHPMLNLCAAGVEVVPCFRFESQPNAPLSLLPQWTEFADENVGLSFDARAAVSELRTWSLRRGAISLEVTRPVDQNESHAFDIVVIHRTQLDVLAERLATSPTSMLEELRRLGQKVVVTSGKGTLLPTDPVRAYPFIEFSVIDSYVIREVWKYGLCSALMSAL